MLPTKFQFIWLRGFRGIFICNSIPFHTKTILFRKHTIINMHSLWRSCLSMDRDEISNIYRGPPIDASYQVLVYLAKWFQRRRLFRYQSIRNKNCLWWPCLLTDWDEMSNRNRGLSIDASFQVSVHLAKWFQRRRFLEINQPETRIACGGHVC